MPEMTRRQRILAAARRQRADRLPFFHYWRHSQVGWAERECRNRGMSMCWVRPSYTERMEGVEIVEQPLRSAQGSVVRRTYHTPLGSVFTEERREPGTGQWHAQRSWRDVSPWTTQRLIKGPEDYPIVQYMVEHTEYMADYFPIEQATDWLGEDGLVLTQLPHSPMQTLMIDWVGSEGGRFFYHLADYPNLVEGLYRALCESRRRALEIAAQAPVEIVLCGDNLDGFLVNPRLFERYFMPVYAEQAECIHAQGKLMAVHMDGRLRVLKELIARTEIDVVEAFHPPPMGDLAVSEALRAWPDKAVWIGFPGAVYALGPEETRRYTLELLRDMAPGDRVAVAMSTENLVSNENLIAVTSVLEKAELPLNEVYLSALERSSS
ncbi:MAG: hypothetical protein H5T69_00025 [Chloroflexi bacterium]|nr:hypothetical protein [Chloroflexota bacterium]